MKKWSERIESQRRVCQEQGKQSFSNVSETEFTYMRGQGRLENPYQEEDHHEDDDAGYADSTFQSSRNASSTSLRSRSTTNESLQQPRSVRPVVPGVPPLTLRTQPTQNAAPSPAERGQGQSYFSPAAESPISISSRTSTSSVLPFQRQPLPQHPSHREEPNRYTAPAAERSTTSRDAHGSYHHPDSRNIASASYAGYPYSASQAFRHRSASNPDMQNVRRPGPAPPVPTVPAHLAHSHNTVNRSQSNSPMSPNIGPPASSANQGYYAHYGASYDGSTRDITPLPLQHDGTMISPSLGSATSLNGEIVQPSQLKVKVKVPSEGSTMTLVVPFNISFQSLKDRIDAKLQRNTSVSLTGGNVKLKYLYDDEFVSIQTDEDVQTAFETWKEQQQDDIVGQLGEIELYCHQ